MRRRDISEPDQDAVLEGKGEIILGGDTAGRNPAGESGETEPSSGPDHPATIPANAVRCHSQPPFACSPTRTRLKHAETRTVDRSFPSARLAPDHRSPTQGRIEIASIET